MKRLDLSGRTFGRLKVVGQADAKPDKAIWWKCICDCGIQKEARGSDLNRGFISSCGCWRSDAPKTKATHGGANTRLYRIWQAMKDRTGNPKASRYSYYGGRGISVCHEWLDFKVFQSWAVANGYDDRLSIDRINNNGNYEPSNCRWATQKMQVNNRRSKSEMERKVA